MAIIQKLSTLQASYVKTQEGKIVVLTKHEEFSPGTCRKKRGTRKLYLPLYVKYSGMGRVTYPPSRQRRWGLLVRRMSSSRWVLRRYDETGSRVVQKRVIEGGLTTEEVTRVAEAMFNMEKEG